MASKRFTFALFGAGRIGKLHFRNLLINERTSVKYIVEENRAAAVELLERYQLEDRVMVLNTQEAGQVYDDKRYYSFWNTC